MRRIFETDAVIIAALILVAGTYKLTTSEDVQTGFVRLVQLLRGNSESEQTSQSVNTVPESDTVGSSPLTPADALPPTAHNDAAGIEVLSPVAVTNRSSIARQSPVSSNEQLDLAVARGRERLARRRVHAVEFSYTSGYTRPCSPSYPVRPSCGRIH